MVVNIQEIADTGDIQWYLKDVKSAEIFLNIDRTPIIGHETDGTTDDYFLEYLFDKDRMIKEYFIELRTKNTTNQPLVKGKLEKNVYPIQKNALEEVWIQIGHRLNFMDKKEISYSLYIDQEMVDLKKKLPELPYSIKTNLTLAEVMTFAKKNFIVYERFKSIWDNPRVVGKVPEELRLTYN